MSEKLGGFESKMASFAFTKTTDGQIQTTASYQGTADGFGAVFGTITLTQPLADAGATSGTVTYVGKARLEDNSVIGGIGEGTWQQIGNEAKYKMSLLINISDGTQIRSEGVIDNVEMTLNGDNYSVD